MIVPAAVNRKQGVQIYHASGMVYQMHLARLHGVSMQHENLHVLFSYDLNDKQYSAVYMMYIRI